MIGTIVSRDLRLAWARGAEGAVSLFFFFAVATLFGVALGAEASLLARAAPGILWIAALLSALLSVEAVWHRDFDDQTFELLLVSGIAPWRIVAAKILSHWVLSGLPLVLASVLVGPMLLLPADALSAAVPGLILGTLYMSLLGGLGALLTCGARRPGLLQALLVLPLFVPMLILGVLGLEAALDGRDFGAYLLLQVSLVLAAVALTPAAGAKILTMQARSS